MSGDGVAREKLGRKRTVAIELNRRPKVYHILAITAILMIAVALRLWGIDFGLPYAYHSDEPAIVNQAVRFFRTGDLNPGWFHYPTFYTYLVAAIYFGCYTMGLWGGEFAYPSEMPAPGWLVMGGGGFLRYLSSS